MKPSATNLAQSSILPFLCDSYTKATTAQHMAGVSVSLLGICVTNSKNADNFEVTFFNKTFCRVEQSIIRILSNIKDGTFCRDSND